MSDLWNSALLDDEELFYCPKCSFLTFSNAKYCINCQHLFFQVKAKKQFPIMRNITSIILGSISLIIGLIMLVFAIIIFREQINYNGGSFFGGGGFLEPIFALLFVFPFFIVGILMGLISFLISRKARVGLIGLITNGVSFLLSLIVFFILT